MADIYMNEEKKSKEFEKLKDQVSKKDFFDENCIVHIALMILADKWILMILMALITGKKRNHELQKRIHGISPKMLSQSLKKLQNYGMVKRKVYPEVPPRVEYRLTEFGKSVAPPLSALCKWSIEREQSLRKAWEDAS